MGVFGKKLNQDLQTTFTKMNGNYKTFGRKYGGDIKKGLNYANDYSKPVLAAASIIQPELAPMFAGIGAGIQGANRLGEIMFAGEEHQHTREHKPRLER